MRPSRAAAVTLVLVVGLICSVALAPAAVGDLAQDDDLEFDADDIVLRADVHDDGDATFSIQYRIALDGEDDRDAFDELAEEIAENEATYLDRFADRFGPAVSDAAAATDREMALVDPAITTETRFLDRQFGVVTYSFTWTAFAVVDGDELHIGDALSGLFLTEDTTLVIQWPETHALAEATPSPDATTDRAASWNGPRDFGPGEPAVVASTAADPPTDDDDGFPVWLALAAAVLALLAVGAGGWYYRRAGTAAGSGAEAAPDELLSNEEQVLRLLREHGGRMKQQEVAEALDWTAAKTSKVVGTLREEGDVEAFRLGRENVLRLPGEGEEP